MCSSSNEVTEMGNLPSYSVFFESGSDHGLSPAIVVRIPMSACEERVVHLLQTNKLSVQMHPCHADVRLMIQQCSVQGGALCATRTESLQSNIKALAELLACINGALHHDAPWNMVSITCGDGSLYASAELTPATVQGIVRLNQVTGVLRDVVRDAMWQAYTALDPWGSEKMNRQVLGEFHFTGRAVNATILQRRATIFTPSPFVACGGIQVSMRAGDAIAFMVGLAGLVALIEHASTE
jgi:hypothetical protein